MSNSKLVSWSDIENYVCAVIEKYSNSALTGVYGLPRGGLVFAVMISHALNIPLLMAPSNGCLIVDDIADTGESLIHYASNPNYHITTMFYHSQSSVVPEFWLHEKTDQWIVYPWEVFNAEQV